MENLALYYSPFCPFCQKVLRYMERNNITVELRNTSDPENLKTLISVGGKNQVPCLFINGKPMYESDDIIVYLGKHFGIK
jgi:glutaredoxin